MRARHRYISAGKGRRSLRQIFLQLSAEKQRKAIIREAQIPEFLALHDLKDFKIKNKRQVLRNCVLPKIGKHILKCALNPDG